MVVMCILDSENATEDVEKVEICLQNQFQEDKMERYTGSCVHVLRELKANGQMFLI